MVDRFMWCDSEIYGRNVIVRCRDGRTLFVCDVKTPCDPHAVWDLIRVLNDPLARIALRETSKDYHNLD